MEVLKEYWERISRRYSFTILMEGNYHYLEGDSATIAQLYAVLSAAGQYLPQAGIVVTGAMNLKGDVLPIGGVTEKAEGCLSERRNRFDLSRDNRRDLYLRPSVTEAVERGPFSPMAYPWSRRGSGTSVRKKMENHNSKNLSLYSLFNLVYNRSAEKPRERGEAFLLTGIFDGVSNKYKKESCEYAGNRMRKGGVP